MGEPHRLEVLKLVAREHLRDHGRGGAEDLLKRGLIERLIRQGGDVEGERKLALLEGGFP
jgi:hypothetical protein